MTTVRVGTSGWSYPAWVGPFYPEGTSAARMLGVYASELATVEAHATYRRLPTPAALARWVATVPPGFRFAPKAHMGISHRRDLDGVEDRVAAFADALGPLGDLVGPVLVSLPHQQPDLDRLDRLLHAFRARSVTTAFDVGPAWATAPVLDRLDSAGATLVVTDSPDRPATDIPGVGPLAYVRLRAGAYTDGDLETWAQRLEQAAAEGRDVYAFVKHDDAAPLLARTLVAHLG